MYPRCLSGTHSAPHCAVHAPCLDWTSWCTLWAPVAQWGSTLTFDWTVFAHTCAHILMRAHHAYYFRPVKRNSYRNRTDLIQTWYITQTWESEIELNRYSWQNLLIWQREYCSSWLFLYYRHSHLTYLIGSLPQYELWLMTVSEEVVSSIVKSKDHLVIIRR